MEDKRYDMTESLAMDDEFQKWLAISDRMQGFGKFAKETSERVISDALAPAQPLTTAAQPTQPAAAQPQAQAQPAQQNATLLQNLKNLKGQKDVQAALAAASTTSPNVKSLLDTLAKLQ